MENISQASRQQLSDLMQHEISTAIGRKVLEFGSGYVSLAEELRDNLEYLACTDKSDAVLQSMGPISENLDIQLIPDNELAEDCYFGRFHMVYTIYGFHDLPHLVDEIMRLRRLILKGGKIVIIDKASFSDECTKQLKRCGFTEITTAFSETEGTPIFLISAIK